MATEMAVYVYSFPDLKRLHTCQTGMNRAGVLAVSASPERVVLATVGRKPGAVRVLQFTFPTRAAHLGSGHSRTSKWSDGKEFKAHSSALACAALNTNGSRLVTASLSGRHIRV